MANIREISGRMKSIRDTMKITNAMYMISSTKMRKAKKSQEGNAPYFRELSMMYDLILDRTPEIENRFLDIRANKTGANRTRGIVIFTADKGLAGAYNHNVLKVAESLMSGDTLTKLYVIGEVGRQYFAGKHMDTGDKEELASVNPDLQRARNVSKKLVDDYLAGVVDEVYVVFTALKNSITSEARFMKLLPFARYEDVTGKTNDVEQKINSGNNATVSLNAENDSGEIKFYPSAEDVLDNVIPSIVTGYIYSALVESYCSEQNDRMMAMDSANKNADVMLHNLSIEYNRVRQAMITQEITEVIAGAKAQKKKKMRKEAQGS